MGNAKIARQGALQIFDILIDFGCGGRIWLMPNEFTNAPTIAAAFSVVSRPISDIQGSRSSDGFELVSTFFAQRQTPSNCPGAVVDPCGRR